MGKKSDLSPECQKFVKKLFAFYSNEKATKKPIVTFDRVYQKTSKALGVSYTSVHRIMNGKQWRSLGLFSSEQFTERSEAKKC
jgi:hypothetical protein